MKMLVLNQHIITNVISNSSSVLLQSVIARAGNILMILTLQFLFLAKQQLHSSFQFKSFQP